MADKKRKMYLRMVLASLTRRRSRMVVALLAIMTGATILSGLLTIYYDVPRQMGSQFRGYGANMILTGADGRLALSEAESAAGLIADDELVGITPFLYSTVRVNEVPVLAAGTEMESAKKTSPYWSVTGEWADKNGELMMGVQVAETFRLHVGDRVPVSYESEGDEGAMNDMEFTLSGILDTGGKEEGYIYMSLEDMAALTGTDGEADVCEISISTDAKGLDRYTELINSSGSNVSARLVKRVTQSETAVLSKLQFLVLLVTIVTLALTMICVATTMTAVVTERRREIGLRKALGASDESVIAEFAGETMLLGAAGGMLGMIFGFCFAQGVSVSVFNSHISFRPLLIPLTMLASIVVTGAASLIPIKSATTVEPALVLKGE